MSRHEAIARAREAMSIVERYALRYSVPDDDRDNTPVHVTYADMKVILAAFTGADGGDVDDMLARFLRGDTSMLKCTICGSQAGTCDCWTKCPCGWSFMKGAKCRNPEHRTRRPS